MEENKQLDLPVLSHPQSPPQFVWDLWYSGIGGRVLDIPEANKILQLIYEEQYPRCNGIASATKREFQSPYEAAETIKKAARLFGADLVGICHIEPSDIYRGKSVNEVYAIVVGMKMQWREFQNVPSQESAIECLRIYHALGEVVVKLANAVRDFGWPATVEHPIGDTNIMHIPLALKAGFGELGRHGSIINPDIGPMFRVGSVLTSIPMTVDSPIDAGIAKFCDNCRACRIYCPADAIPDERSPLAGKDHLGYDKYQVDTGKCFPYFAKYNYCSICLPVCVYNHKKWAKDDIIPTSLFPNIQMENPPNPFDGINPNLRHEYPRVNREKQGKEFNKKNNKK